MDYDDDFYDWEEYLAPIEVYISCLDKFIPEDDVKMVNIQEDMQGRDLLTFICPECGEVHESYRLG